MYNISMIIYAAESRVLCFYSFYFNKMRISLPTIPVSFHLAYHLFCFQTMLSSVQHVESTSGCLSVASLMQVIRILSRRCLVVSEGEWDDTSMLSVVFCFETCPFFSLNEILDFL